MGPGMIIITYQELFGDYRTWYNSHYVSAGISVRNINFCVIDDNGLVDGCRLQEATNDVLRKVPYDILEERCSMVFDNLESGESDSIDVVNSVIVRETLESIKRTDSGNLIMPILWNELTGHLLGTNLHLARSVLLSNLRKISKNPD